MLEQLEIGTITEEASHISQHTPLSRVPSQEEVDVSLSEPSSAAVGMHRTHISRSRMLRPSNLGGMDDDDEDDVDVTPMMLAAKLKEKRPTTDGRGHRIIAAYDSAMGHEHDMNDFVPALDRERSTSYMPFDNQRERTASYGSDLGQLAYDEFMVSEIQEWPLEGTTPRSHQSQRFSTLSTTGLTMIVSKSKRPSEPPTPKHHGVELSEENVGDSIW